MGKSNAKFGGDGVDGGGASELPWTRTCPRYFRQSPFFLSVWEELADYEAGRWGHVEDMPNALLGYLRIASVEKKGWDLYQQATR